jgi:ribosomal protein L4
LEIEGGRGEGKGTARQDTLGRPRSEGGTTAAPMLPTLRLLVRVRRNQRRCALQLDLLTQKEREKVIGEFEHHAQPPPPTCRCAAGHQFLTHEVAMLYNISLSRAFITER